MEQNNGGSAVGIILGIVSLVVSIIGGISFGVIGAGVAIVCGVIGIILSVKTKKETDGEKGTGGLVTSILGIVFAAIFAIGCTLCGGAVSSATGGATSAGMCYGCVGVKIFAENATNDAKDAFKNFVQENNSDPNAAQQIEDAFNSIQEQNDQ